MKYIECKQNTSLKTFSLYHSLMLLSATHLPMVPEIRNRIFTEIRIRNMLGS